MPVPSAALEVKPLHETTEGRVFQILVYIISAHHNLFCLQNTCTSKKNQLMRQTPGPSPSCLRHVGAERQSENPRRPCPGQGPFHLYTARREAKPLYQSTLYSLGFFKTYHLPCVRACVCFPGRTPLELLIFGNVAVLYESKHATRFRGQAVPLFSALVSRGLLTVLPEGTRDRSHRGDHSGERCPSKHHPPRPRNTGSCLPTTKASCAQVPGGLGRDFRRLSLCFRLSLLFILGKSQAEPRKIFISPPLPSHHGNALVSEEACSAADEMPPIKAFQHFLNPGQGKKIPGGCYAPCANADDPKTCLIPVLSLPTGPRTHLSPKRLQGADGEQRMGGRQRELKRNRPPGY